jgi:hypothetical protein
MILVAAMAWGSESCCLSDGGAQPARRGAGWPELVPAAAGVLAAQGDDAGGENARIGSLSAAMIGWMLLSVGGRAYAGRNGDLQESC